MGSLHYRLATPQDAAPASLILTLALDELAVRQGRPPQGAPNDPTAPAFRHLMQTDPERFWIAVGDDERVGFGTAWIREGSGRSGSLGWCGGLFVLPEWQGKGVGRQLFELAMEGLPTPRGIAALTSSAANPVSNRLYARHGIYPLFPVLELDGPVPATSGLPRDMTGEPLEPAHLDELAEIDSVVLGVDRTPEHRWHLAQAGHRGWLLRRGEKAVGYVYLGGDGPAEDAVGPVATLDAADQEVALRLAFGELSRRGQKRCNVSVPGPNLAAQRLLWDAGFSFSGATGLLCASRPFGRFDRYLLAGDCLM